MEEYQGKSKSYEEAKLKVISAVLETIGIKIEDNMGEIAVTRDGVRVATIQMEI